MKILKAALVIASFFLIGAFVGAKYLSEKENSPPAGPTQPSVRIDENTSIADLMEYLSIYRVNEPWMAPDFTITGLNGEKVSMGEHRGKYLLLAFWTTW